MKNKIYNIVQKTIQATYITTFVITTMGIGGNLDTNRPITPIMQVIYGISAMLTFGKIWYCTRKGEQNMKKLAIIILIILATHLTTIKTIKLIYSDKNVVILESFGIEYEYYKF